MTTKRRRRFTADFKKRVALEALRGDRTVQAIAAKHEVHPNQVGTWKRQAIEGLDEVFARGGSPGPSEHEATRWPRAWIVSGAVSRVAPNSRGTRIAQQGVLLLRLHHRQWPAPADDVAGWIDVDRTLSTLRSSRRRSRPDG